MPALGHTQTEEAIRFNFESMSRLEFMRAFLNIPTIRVSHEPIWDLDLWESLADPVSELDGFNLALGLDVNPERTGACLAAYGVRADGLQHAEIVAYERKAAGFASLVAEVWERQQRPPLLLDPSGAAGSLIPELDDLGVLYVLAGMRDMTAACGRLSDAITEKQLRHLDEAPLNAAVAAARKRDLAGAYAFHRRDTTDISPLVSVALAGQAWASRGVGSAPLIAYR